tara:strand:+ start:42 stop:557 length:516 start_codon:yes stop_codon:yes gene_type:complete
MKTILSIIILLILPAASIFAQDNSHSHEEHLGKLLASYFEMKDALVADDFKTAKQALIDFTEEVKNDPEMIDHKKHATKHAMHHSAMVSAVDIAGSSTDIKTLRDSFDEITVELLKAIENQGYTDGEMYVQFCPMADGGNGAKWISKEKKIMNPYFGSMMLNCGSVVDTIN